jgi:hypothetical protein
VIRDLTGSDVVYAGGGGGGGDTGGSSETGGAGGSGGNASSAFANTGGGGGGGGTTGGNGGKGGSGIVVVRYRLPSTVTVTGATNETGSGATLEGTLSASGEFAVTAYVSTADHATSAAWVSDGGKKTVSGGTFTNAFEGEISVTIGSLNSATQYYFTFKATDGVTELWAPVNGSFRTTGSKPTTFRFR